MRVFKITGVVFLALTIQACATHPRSAGGPPVEDRSTGSNNRYPVPSTSADRPSVHATAPALSYSMPLSSSVQTVPLPVANLLAQANRQRDAAEYGKAVATVERAMRIAPRNALVWFRLAEIRTDEKKYPLAESLAVKSISLAKTDRGMKYQNWTLIASIRDSVGDVGGAREARIRAREYQ